METIAKLALAKAFNDDAAKRLREQVAPGSYLVDCWVRLKGVLSIGQDTRAKNVAKLCPWTLAVLALDKLNAETRAKVMLEAVGALAEGREIDTEGVKAETARMCEDLKSLTEAPRKGQAKFKGDLQIMDGAAAVGNI